MGFYTKDNSLIRSDATSSPTLEGVHDVGSSRMISNYNPNFVYTSSLTSQPSFLTRYTTDNKSLSSNNVAFTGSGLKITGGAAGASYPIRINFDIPGNHGFRLRCTIYRGERCDDHGFCLFKSTVTPRWKWGLDSTRYAIQGNCAIPWIYATPTGSAYNLINALNPTSGTTNPSFYSFEWRMNTSSSTMDMKFYAGNNTYTGTPVISKVGLSNPLSSMGISSTDYYRFGFDTDQDNTSYSPYFRNLEIIHGTDLSGV